MSERGKESKRGVGVGEKAAFNEKKAYRYKRQKNDRRKVRPAWRNGHEGDEKDGWSVEEESESACNPEFSFRYFITVALWEE